MTNTNIAIKVGMDRYCISGNWKTRPSVSPKKAYTGLWNVMAVLSANTRTAIHPLP